MQTSTTVLTGKLYIGIEMSNKSWRLCFCDGRRVRHIAIVAGDHARFSQEVERAREKLGLPPETPVLTCYEAGRDGFWFHRFLMARGVENVVVDAGSIEVPRKGRRVKTDRVDAEGLVRRLMRFASGEQQVWSVARVPAVEQEDARRASRERERLVKEQGGHWARIWSLLKLHGVDRCGKARLREHLNNARQWDGTALPDHVRSEIGREHDRIKQIDAQLKQVREEWAVRVEEKQTHAAQKAAKLEQLKSLGPTSSMVLALEVFGWRRFRNRREVGAMAGLCDAPFASGDLNRSQGISKSGNRRTRSLMIELAWMWLRFQPDSELSRWYRQRFGNGGGRSRRIGIVALARKLLIALWHWVEHDQLPAGAKLREA
jgi:transposase